MRNQFYITRFRFTRAIVSVIIFALLANLTGCTIFGPKETLPAPLEVRPLEEIEQTGISPEDVLAAFDQLASITAKHVYEQFKDDLGDKFYDIDARFISIAPPMCQKAGEQALAQLSFYPMDSTAYHYPPWFDDLVELNNIYSISFHVKLLYKGKTADTCYNMLVLPQDEFISIAESFDATSFNVTSNDIAQEIKISGADPFMFENSTAYTGFTITRESILNANDKQLWALYNAATQGFLLTNFGSLEDAYDVMAEAGN